MICFTVVICQWIFVALTDQLEIILRCLQAMKPQKRQKRVHGGFVFVQFCVLWGYEEIVCAVLKSPVFYVFNVGAIF